MSDTMRAAFEQWYEHDFMGGLDGPGEWDEERNCYVVFGVHMAWKGWQAAQSQPVPPIESKSEATRAKGIADVYDKLHAGKLGAHMLWCVIEKVANGIPEDEALREFGYVYQDKPAPPVPSSVQEIMRLMIPYVEACTSYSHALGYSGRAEEEQRRLEAIPKAFKPLETALAALVEKNHELQFSLDGVNAMRRPLMDDLVRQVYRSVFDENAPRIYGIAERFARAIEKAHGIEPEQGEVK